MNSDAEEPDGAEDTDEVPQLAARGRSSFFMLLTCGFLACLCCVGSVFIGGSVAWARTANLEAAVGEIGAPEGWRTDDSSAMPWGGEAELSGPAEAEAVTDWLTDLNADVARGKVADCLTGRPCTAEFTVDGFSAVVEYGPRKSKAYASVQVG